MLIDGNVLGVVFAIVVFDDLVVVFTFLWGLEKILAGKVCECVPVLAALYVIAAIVDDGVVYVVTVLSVVVGLGVVHRIITLFIIGPRGGRQKREAASSVVFLLSIFVYKLDAAYIYIIRLVAFAFTSVGCDKGTHLILCYISFIVGGLLLMLLSSAAVIGDVAGCYCYCYGVNIFLVVVDVPSVIACC